MNAITKSGQQASIPIDALGGGTGGPLPVTTPWINYGSYLGYSYGITIGQPTGGNTGPGTINAQNNYFINGQPLSALFQPHGITLVTSAAVAPVSPQAGELWWDTTGGNLYIYYDDGTSAQWVIVVNKTGLQGASNLIPVSEAVQVTAANQLGPFKKIPSSTSPISLVVNGRPFYAADPTPAFTVSGTAITWISTIYSIQLSDSVTGVYYTIT